jgi:DedD protein
VPSHLPDDAEVQAAAEAASLPEPSLLPERSSAPLSPPDSERKSDAKLASVTTEPARPVVKAAPPPASVPTAARFVVQVGAFADKQAAQLARKKLERQGLKTYAQVAKTAQGDRIRVRLGPFASRAEADKAAQKAKAAGLAGAVLAL